jgi:hypothetical protein
MYKNYIDSMKQEMANAEGCEAKLSWAQRIISYEERLNTFYESALDLASNTE